MTNGESKLGHTRKSLDYWMFSTGGMVTTITDPTRALGLNALIQTQHTARVRFKTSSIPCRARRFHSTSQSYHHKLHIQDGRERESFEARTEYLRRSPCN